MTTYKTIYVLNPFQIKRCSAFSRYIDFTMYLDIVYIYVHSKYNISRRAKTSYNLERREHDSRHACLVSIYHLKKHLRRWIAINEAVRWSEIFSQPADPHSQVTVHQTSQTVFFSHNKPAGTVFFSQVSDQRTGPL